MGYRCSPCKIQKKRQISLLTLIVFVGHRMGFFRSTKTRKNFLHLKRGAKRIGLLQFSRKLNDVKNQ